jgi:bifunctional DNA-binding transcriptional regulator/antitoxin component of YhaV-PrlF toxin-antitoxin module
MGLKTKIQVIERGSNRQFYIMIPAPVGHALEIEKGEEIEWIIETKEIIVIKRDKQKPISKAAKAEKR